MKEMNNVKKLKLKSTRIMILSTLALGLTACSVGPDYVRTQTTAVSSFTRDVDSAAIQAGEPIATRVETDWWKAYQSEALNQVVDLALKNNPTIEAALANLKVAKANVRAQQGFFFPSVGAGYSGSRGNVGNYVSAPTSVVNGDSSYSLQTAQLSVGFTPDIFGLNRRQVESLKAQANSAQYQLDALKITVASNVIAAIMQEATLSEQFTAQQESVKLGLAQVVTARKLFSTGYFSRVDLANQESAYAATQQAGFAVKKALDQTRDLIAVLCGQYPSEALKLVELSAMKIPAHLPRAVPSQLVDQRPDVMAAEELVKAANAQIGVAVANMLPQFSIVAAMGGASNAINTLFASGNPFWGVTGNLSQTVFDAGTLYFRKEAAEAATAQALAQYKATVLVAYQNVADTLYALEMDRQALDAALENEKALLAIATATKQQFDKGYAAEPAFQLVQQSYLSAKTARLQAQATYMGDTVALYQSLGGGWTRESSDAGAGKRD